MRISFKQRLEPSQIKMLKYLPKEDMKGIDMMLGSVSIGRDVESCALRDKIVYFAISLAKFWKG